MTEKMAIYHCAIKNISRGQGRSATASSAYRSGEKIHDKRTDITHDYTKKKGVIFSQILSKENIKISREELWNLAEEAEKRKDARTAKEIVIALPHELSGHDRKDLALEFGNYLVNRYNCVVDVALHQPNKEGDDRNYHAHIMITTRQAETDEQGALKLTDKITLELSDSKRKKLNLDTSKNDILSIRKAWEELANQHLEQAGRIERIDHRSYEEIGNGKQAQKHEGTSVTAMRRDGKSTEIGKINDQRKAYNEEIDREKSTRENKIIAESQARLDERVKERYNNQETYRPHHYHSQDLENNQDYGIGY